MTRELDQKAIDAQTPADVAREASQMPAKAIPGRCNEERANA